MRPSYPGPSREWAGVLGFLLLLISADRYSTYVLHSQLAIAGLLYLVAIVFVACWAGLRPALACCLILVCYVWLIYAYPISAFPKDRTKLAQALLSTSIVYSIFAVTFGVVQMRLRAAAIREFDARTSAEIESQQRRIAQRELWASEEMRNLIVRSSADAIIAVAENGAITTWNPNAEKLFGWAQADALGYPIGERLVSADQSRISGILDLPSGTPLGESMEAKVLTKEGEEIAIDLYVVAQSTSSGALQIVFARDISDRKRAEQEVKDLNASLEERVAERTAQLEAANRELVAFSYSISHDLRAPLRAIVGNSRIVREDALGVLNEEAISRLTRLESNALKMAELIENLLQFARIGQAALNPGKIDLTAMAEGIAKELKSGQDGRIEVQAGLFAQGDPDMVKMLLLNLMENAWKYVREGQKASIEVGQTPEGVFFVRDHGIGFDMQYVEKIWEPFERLHRDTEYPGTGIGLANCKRIVERHGGKIWAESAPGEGTTMYFDLTSRRRPAIVERESSYAI